MDSLWIAEVKQPKDEREQLSPIFSLSKTSILLTFTSSAFYRDVFASIFFILIKWFYFVIVECSSYQVSFRKKTIGIKVTYINGNGISFLKVRFRYVGKIVSQIAF